MPEDLASENEDNFIMGWILLVHLIWVNSDVVSRGGWAGDRFELTGKDLEEDGRKWTDVSEESLGANLFNTRTGLSVLYYTGYFHIQ